MIKKLDLQGQWQFALDKQKQGMPTTFSDFITLPNTTSYAKKGKLNTEIKINCLTDEYAFEGWAWFRKEVEIPKIKNGERIALYLERTRITRLWIDDAYIGTQNSLCTPHIYEISNTLYPGKHVITLCVDNTNYPTKGGHLTSEDTQTNWNGITGAIEFRFFNDYRLKDVMVFSNVLDKSVTIKGVLENETPSTLLVEATSFNTTVLNHDASSAKTLSSEASHHVPPMTYAIQGKSFEITYHLGDKALLWDEHHPNLYKLTLKRFMGSEPLSHEPLQHEPLESEILDKVELTFGLKEFKGVEDKFVINSHPTFLRGKHDGLIFPQTGFAPTDLDSWLRILSISKAHGINHYRFHTCCPPEAAFEAADRLGIYMQPELPFWGTITEKGEANHNQTEQDYLIHEGFNMLRTYGNHPSFVMMSLGNELWGSQTKLNEILGAYKKFDPRHLYTQGSNNFQFTPCILENDDFFSGVRFGHDRLIRGSYAMCDAPQGILQTAVPNTHDNFDDAICPPEFAQATKAASRHHLMNSNSGQALQNGNMSAITELNNSSNTSDASTMEIQYGTGVKTVKLSEMADTLIPHVPVISHEVGQYEFFPNFDEITKYTGPLKARNLEVFRDRLREKGLLDLAPDYFKATGQLAVKCYKQEIEMALRSKRLAGFQLLDLQDFSGQGTALVGVLDAFMDSKGLISPEDWRHFCSDAVLLADFGEYIYEAEEPFTANIQLSYYRDLPLKEAAMHWQLKTSTDTLAEGSLPIAPSCHGLCDMGKISLMLPNVTVPTPVTLSLAIPNTEIYNHYNLMLYPHLAFDLKEAFSDHNETLYIVHNLKEAKEKLEAGERVLLIPDSTSSLGSLPTIEGTYCTDFWCYPMFRSISESVNKPIPIGTMGLLIQNEHPALADFPSEIYTTPCWYHLITHADCQILDELFMSTKPIVQMIDNFERNHNLGIVYEAKLGDGKLLICTSRLAEIWSHIEVRHFAKSLVKYGLSNHFSPTNTLRELSI